MARTVVISEDELKSMLKVEEAIEAFSKFYDSMMSLTDKERKMLVKSLEFAQSDSVGEVQ